MVGTSTRSLVGVTAPRFSRGHHNDRWMVLSTRTPCSEAYFPASRGLLKEYPPKQSGEWLPVRPVGTTPLWRFGASHLIGRGLAGVRLLHRPIDGGPRAICGGTRSSASPKRDARARLHLEDLESWQELNRVLTRSTASVAQLGAVSLSGLAMSGKKDRLRTILPVFGG